MLPSPLSSLSFTSVSFLQFALALFEQLLVHSLLSLSPSLPLYLSLPRFLSLFFLAPSLSLTLAIPILSRRHFVSFKSL